MIDMEYVISSVIWAIYGLVTGLAIGVIAELVWANIKRR